MTPSLFFALFLASILLVVGADNGYVPVNIATASNAAINDSWARFVYWQHPNGKIMVQQRFGGGLEPQEIDSTVAPKAQSPLAALYSPSTTYKGAYDLVVSYLDSTNHTIDATCRYENKTYLNWSTHAKDTTSASGLALVNFKGQRRRFYVNADNDLVQDVQGTLTPLGPKVAKGSNIAATVPVGSTGIHVFFIPDDDMTSLASLTFNGSVWSETLPSLPSFAPEGKPDIGFAVAAWSNPLIARIFHINQDASASEWTYTDGSWTATSKDEFKVQGATAGEPVAASQSVNGSGRHIEYFYTTTENAIVYLAKNSVDGMIFQNKFTEFELEKPASTGLSRSDKISLGVGIGVGLGVGLPTISLMLLTFREPIKRYIQRDAGDDRWHRMGAVVRGVLAFIFCVRKPKSNGHRSPSP